ILSSHTHHHFDYGERVNGVLLAAAGRYGEYIGEVTLEFEGRKLIRKKAALIESDILSQIENDYYNKGKAILKNTIIKEDALPIDRRLYSAGRFSSFLAYILKDFTDSDAGLIHTGLI